MLTKKRPVYGIMICS